jgi:hypothetical protein
MDFNVLVKLLVRLCALSSVDELHCKHLVGALHHSTVTSLVNSDALACTWEHFSSQNFGWQTTYVCTGHTNSVYLTAGWYAVIRDILLWKSQYHATLEGDARHELFSEVGLDSRRHSLPLWVNN